MRAFYLLPILVILSACGGAPEEVKLIHYDSDVTLVTSLSGSGGALGDETYRIAYRYNGKDTPFFEGVNPRGFSVSKQGKLISIRFCDGTVHLAQPIFLAAPRNELVHLQLVMDCAGDRAESEAAR